VLFFETTRPPITKKADVVEQHRMLYHVGLLFDEPPGKAEMSFI
jgi:hypothetical protein